MKRDDRDYNNFVARMGSFEDDFDDLGDLSHLETATSKSSLTHYGIKGMKWGVRRVKTTVDNASRVVGDGKKINDSVKNIKATKRRSEPSDMDLNELRERVTRMNLEQQYVNLSKSQVSKGQEYISNTLNIAGSVLSIASTGLGVALAIKNLQP